MKSEVENLLNRMRTITPFKSLFSPAQKEFHLHNVITGCGHEIVHSETYSHKGKEQGDKMFSSLQLTLGGCGTLQFENQTYELRKGDMFLVMVPQDYHYYLPKTSESWEFVYITFAGSEAIRILNTVQKILSPVCKISSIQILFAFDEILTYASKKHTDVFFFSSLGYTLLMTLISHIYEMKINIKNPQIVSALRFCQQYYHKQLKIENIAQHVHLSPFHFSRVFHKEVGMTVQTYVETIRINKALEQIISSNKSIKTIAHECGFSNNSYFSKVFKKHYGETPSVYKKNR